MPYPFQGINAGFCFFLYQGKKKVENGIRTKEHNKTSRQKVN